MRYLNWDVLLFPIDGRTPMQEFKTGCYVIPDEEPMFGEPSSFGGYVRQMPTVASFIASQPDGTPFRASIFSWQRPEPTAGLKALLQGGREMQFEVRIYLDGSLVGAVALTDLDTWPQIITQSARLDRTGEPDLLRWPKFHSELLSESEWNAADVRGRIKVVISEGFRAGGPGGPYTRTKNIVSFSFQHAPQNILELSRIAWPNPSMWIQPLMPLYTRYSPTRQDTSQEDLDLHAHSPRRRPGVPLPRMSMMAPQLNPTNIGGYPQFGAMSGYGWSGQADPFIENNRGSVRSVVMQDYGSIRSGDVSMADYSATPSNSSGSRVPSGNFPSGPESLSNGLTPSHPEPAFESLIQMLQSPLAPASGVIPPTNSRVSSVVNSVVNSVTTTPTVARARLASESHDPSHVLVPDVTTNRNQAVEKKLETLNEAVPEQRSNSSSALKELGTPRSGSVGGRKEGRNAPSASVTPQTSRQVSQKRSLRDSHQPSMDKENNEAGHIIHSTERKRRAVTLPNTAVNSPVGSSSVVVLDLPSFKNTAPELTDEAIIARAPLGSLNNVS